MYCTKYEMTVNKQQCYWCIIETPAYRTHWEISNLFVQLKVTGYLRNFKPHGQSCLVSPQMRGSSTQSSALPSQFWRLFCCCANILHLVAITSPRPGTIIAELSMSLTHILLFLPTARPAGLKGLWWCSACLLTSDWKQCVSHRTKEKRGAAILHSACYS